MKSTDKIPSWEEVQDGIVIKTPVEFNFKSNLGYLERDKNECMFEVKNGVITRIIPAGGGHALVQVSSCENDDLFVRLLTDTKPDSIERKMAVVRYIADWFDLETNLAPFYEMAQNDPLLKRLVTNSYGLRLIGVPDLFEALCWGVLGQQINLRFAYRLKRQFVETFGKAIFYNGNPYWIHPTYETIAKLTPEELADIKMTMRKSEYIIGIAKLMEQDELSKRKLLELRDFKKVEKELTSIRGIGPWTANYVLMRCLRYPEAFPIDDIGLINAIKFVQEMERKPTKEEIKELAIPWGNWEAYATFYLWRAV
ncbi:DNA-3-methyladenine glycosylase family protein [Virgibacillus sp. W0181]|uniref:DNA-3-methyladenine glycosylase family protein n=1 Tax=Virgibacillus sp. W0181 TaxID=3391581 RepID=UPI003F47D66E